MVNTGISTQLIISIPTEVLRGAKESLLGRNSQSVSQPSATLVPLVTLLRRVDKLPQKWVLHKWVSPLERQTWLDGAIQFLC